MWESAGRPRSGHVFNIMKNAKYTDKLAIKDAVNSFENKFSDELYDCLMSKDLHKFCKTWKHKCCDNVVNINSIDVNTDDLTIADIFMKKFKIHSSSGTNSSETSDTPTLHGIVSLDHLKDDVDDWLFSVEDVDRAVFSKLKRGKAPGFDGLSPEHLVTQVSLFN